MCLFSIGAIRSALWSWEIVYCLQNISGVWSGRGDRMEWFSQHRGYFVSPSKIVVNVALILVLVSVHWMHNFVSCTFGHCWPGPMHACTVSSVLTQSCSTKGLAYRGLHPSNLQGTRWYRSQQNVPHATAAAGTNLQDQGIRWVTWGRRRERVRESGKEGGRERVIRRGERERERD